MTVAELAQHLQGPIGGMLAGAFGLGAATGYAFCARTQLRDAMGRISRIEAAFGAFKDEHEAELKELRDAHSAERTALIAEIHKWQDLYIRLTKQEVRR